MENQAIKIEYVKEDLVCIFGSIIEFKHLVNRIYDFVNNNEEEGKEKMLHLEPVTELDDNSLPLTIELVTNDFFNNISEHIPLQVINQEKEIKIFSTNDGLYYLMQLLIEMLEVCKTKKKEESIEMILEKGSWILNDSLSLEIKIK